MILGKERRAPAMTEVRLPAILAGRTDTTSQTFIEMKHSKEMRPVVQFVH